MSLLANPKCAAHYSLWSQISMWHQGPCR